MTKIIWIVLGLILLGNALFLLPLHWSSDSVTCQYNVNYKKDTLLLQDAFGDTVIRLKLTMPGKYQAIYNKLEKPTPPADNDLNTNVVLSHNTSFTPLAFPFYKASSFSATITFQCIIRNIEQQGIDSVALIGHIEIDGRLRVFGISSPIEARKEVENELVKIIHKEAKKIEADINNHLRVTFPEEVEELPAEVVVPLETKQADGKRRHTSNRRKHHRKR